MPRLAANLSTLFTEVPFLDRFAAARASGFSGVEFLFPYDVAATEVAQARDDAGVEVALFNMPPGRWEEGERGIAALPGREREFLQSLERVAEYADALRCATVHAMAGLCPPGVDTAVLEATYIGNLRAAADRLAVHDLTLTIEPINTRDMPRYFLCSAAQAAAVIAAVDRPNVRLQLDLYHAQVSCGDLSGTIARHFNIMRHVQVAGHPGRHEPDVGEIHYPYVFAELDRLGYGGWIGCEYRPRADTRSGLAWAAAYGIMPK